MRSGHVFGTAGKTRIGIQGKNTISSVTEATLEAEIKNAESFQPPLHQLYIVTTASRDAKLQRKARDISEDRRKVGKFEVFVLFWGDISQDLASDDAVFFKHYPQFGARDNSVKEHDKALIEKLSEVLSSDGVIGFLDRTNMAGFSFPLEQLRPPEEFYYNWNTPENEFITAEIETAKKAAMGEGWRISEIDCHGDVPDQHHRLEFGSGRMGRRTARKVQTCR